MSLVANQNFDDPVGHYSNPIIDRLTWLILMVGIVAYILLSPFYVFQSGLPQPADFIMLLTAGLVGTIFVFKRNLIFNRIFASLLLMVGLFTTINLSNFYYFRDTIFLYGSIYYIFNALVFCAVVILFKTNPVQFVRFVKYAITVSLVFQLIWILFTADGSFIRNAGTFNNPNQLGYWALLSACGLLVLSYGQRMHIFDFIGFLSAFILALESLSRAVALSFALLIVLLLIGRYIGPILKLLMLLAVFGLCLVQFILWGDITFLPSDIFAVQGVLDRVEGGPAALQALEYRGFGRILDYPQYILFGAGEGGYYRFSTVSLEIHSGIGTILFSYGILGLLLFGIFSISVFRYAPMALWITLVAVTLYGLTHQHIRFTGFWLYMGLVYGVSVYYLPVLKTAKK